MKYKPIFATALLLGISTMAAAVPDQPFMRAAHADLKTAKRQLQRAKPDKGGHRANALDLVKDAISEVKKGIDAAR